MSFFSQVGSLFGLEPAAPPEYSPATRAALDAFCSRLSLYHYYTCPFCARVHRFLQRLGLEVTLRDVSMVPEYRAELVAGGGRQTVPCLRIEQDDGEVVWMYESADIIAWLSHEVARIREQTGEPSAVE